MNLLEAKYICDEIERICDNDLTTDQNEDAIKYLDRLKHDIKQSVEAILIE